MKLSTFSYLTMFMVFLLTFYFYQQIGTVLYGSSHSHRYKSRITTCKNTLFAEHDLLVTTLLTDGLDYVHSAVKLLKSINKNCNSTKFDMIALELTEKPLSTLMKQILEKSGWKICQVDRIAPRNEANTFFRFVDQFTKLILWNMTEYNAIVYFDSDTLVVGPIDKLLNVHHKIDQYNYKIACTRDIRYGSWVDTFNMGVFAIRPDRAEYDFLIRLKNELNFQFDPDMAEQSFLNVIYKNKWYEFGFENNANVAAYLHSRNVWDNSSKNVIHYTLAKPWQCGHEYRNVCALWHNFDTAL